MTCVLHWFCWPLFQIFLSHRALTGTKPGPGDLFAHSLDRAVYFPAVASFLHCLIMVWLYGATKLPGLLNKSNQMNLLFFPSDSSSLTTLMFNSDSPSLWNWRVGNTLVSSECVLSTFKAVHICNSGLCSSVCRILGSSLVHFPACGLCWFIVPLWLPLHGDVTGFQEADKWLSVRTDELHCESRGLTWWDEGQMYRNANGREARRVLGPALMISMSWSGSRQLWL